MKSGIYESGISASEVNFPQFFLNCFTIILIIAERGQDGKETSDFGTGRGSLCGILT